MAGESHKVEFERMINISDFGNVLGLGLGKGCAALRSVAENKAEIT